MYSEEVKASAIKLSKEYKPRQVMKIIKIIYGVDVFRNTLLLWRKESNKMTCEYCEEDLNGYSLVDIMTHMKEKHKVSILDRR